MVSGRSPFHPGGGSLSRSCGACPSSAISTLEQVELAQLEVAPENLPEDPEVLLDELGPPELVVKIVDGLAEDEAADRAVKVEDEAGSCALGLGDLDLDTTFFSSVSAPDSSLLASLKCLSMKKSLNGTLRLLRIAAVRLL